MAEFLVWLGPSLSSIAASAKLLILASELSNVEAEITIYHKQLQHNSRTIASVISQFTQKHHLLDDGFRRYIELALIDSKDGLAQIEKLIEKMRETIRKKKKVSFRQRVTWAFGDTDLARALDKYIAGCHATMVGIDTRLGGVRVPRPRKEVKQPEQEEIGEFWKRKNTVVKSPTRKQAMPKVKKEMGDRGFVERLGEAIAPKAVYGRSARRSARKDDAKTVVEETKQRRGSKSKSSVGDDGVRVVVSEVSTVPKSRRSSKTKSSDADGEVRVGSEASTVPKSRRSSKTKSSDGDGEVRVGSEASTVPRTRRSSKSKSSKSSAEDDGAREAVSEASTVPKSRRSSKTKNSAEDDEIAWFVKKNSRYG